jgi:hypothetical protein
MEEPAFDIVIVPPDGAKVIPEFTISAPATEKEVLYWDWAVGVAAMVRPENIRFVVAPPLFAMEEPAFDIVIVPPDGANVLVEFTVSAPATENEVLYCDWAVGVSAMVRPEKVSEVPEFEIDEPAADIVIVPPEGLNVAVEEFVKVPAILKSLPVVTVAPEAMVKP